jgi:choice-of-anchor B domain-containing protein
MKSDFLNRPSFYFFAFIAVIVGLVGMKISALLAHDEGPAHHRPLPAHATQVMRAFQNDLLEPQALQSLRNVACEGGSAGTYPCSNVHLEAFMPLSEIGGTSTNSAANDIWGWTDPQTGKEYAIIGRVFGTSFVDISAPANPIYLGSLPTAGQFGSSWRDIKVYQNHAFIVSEATGHGMQVFDLTELRNVSAANAPVTFSATAHFNKISSAHNIVINEDSGFAYIVGASGKKSCSGGLYMVDIRNPASPSFAGCFSADGYTHDAQCVIYHGPDANHWNKEICFNSNEDTLTIVDVTNKGAPSILSRVAHNSVGYTHQGWLTDDHTFFLVDDELDEYYGLVPNTRTIIFDVSNLNQPIVAQYFQNSATQTIDHNQYVRGNLAFQANYQAGLRILDIGDVSGSNPVELGYFDVYSNGDQAGFNGAWSVYPFFKSGVIIVSGIEQGLFVLRPAINLPPSVRIVDPPQGASVPAGNLTVQLEATDVEQDLLIVQMSLNGGTPTACNQNPVDPNSYSCGPAVLTGGAHRIEAFAYDTAGRGSTAVTVTASGSDPPPDPGTGAMFVNLNPGSEGAPNGRNWTAHVGITVLREDSSAVVADATVSGQWSDGAKGKASCTTDITGACSVSKGGLKTNTTSVTFTVTGVSHATLVYSGSDSVVVGAP